MHWIDLDYNSFLQHVYYFNKEEAALLRQPLNDLDIYFKRDRVIIEELV